MLASILESNLPFWFVGEILVVVWIAIYLLFDKIGPQRDENGKRTR